MKYFLSFSIIFLLCLSANGQVTQGKITYKNTIKMDRGTPPEMKAMGRELPKERVRMKDLFFNQSGSIYKDGTQIKTEEEPRRRRRRNRRSGDNQYYKDLKANTTVDKRDLMGKSFIIEDDPVLQWKMTGEQRNILNYVCMKASTEKDSSVIYAWFTPQIPLSVGPGSFHGLPGAVLAVESDNGKLNMIASDIQLNEEFDLQIKAPEKGDKISTEEFQKLYKEKMKEREKMRGQRGFGRGQRGRF